MMRHRVILNEMTKSMIIVKVNGFHDTAIGFYLGKVQALKAVYHLVPADNKDERKRSVIWALAVTT
jgi:hypothetical protein